MDSQWLNKQFELNPGRTKAGLARALGLEPPAISKILKGTRQIKAKEYALMRSYFGLPSGEMVQSYPDAKASSSSYDYALLEDKKPFDAQDWIIPQSVFVDKVDEPPEQVKIFKIEDGYMAPVFMQGDYVVADLSDVQLSSPGRFIVSDGFGYFVRQCEALPSSDPLQVRVSALSADFSTQTLNFEDLQIIGRVIAKVQWL